MYAYSIKYNVLIKEISRKAYRLGHSNSTLRYPYRVKTKNGKVKLVKDPSKGLKK